MVIPLSSYTIYCSLFNSCPHNKHLELLIENLLRVCSFLYHLQVCFEVSVLEKLPVTMPETETNPHVVRVGWSVDKANLQVGMIGEPFKPQE